METKATLKQAEQIIRSKIVHAFKNKFIPENILVTGKPGIGKSAMVNSIRKYVADELKIDLERVKIIDIRLGGMEASEVQGVPYVSAMDLMKYATPPWFPPHDDTENYYIILMDEITNAPQDVQHAAYRPVLDRTCQNGTKLPDRCAIIALGNRPEDNTGAKQLKPAFANRFGIIMDIDRVEDGFRDWLVSQDWDMDLTSFLMAEQYTQYVAMCPKKGSKEMAYATPRSWEAVNRHLSTPGITVPSNSDDDQLLRISIAGAVGSAVMTEFMSYRRFNSFLPNWDDVKLGRSNYTIDRSENMGIYAVTSGAALICMQLARSQQQFQGKPWWECVDNVAKIVEEIGGSYVVTFASILARDPALIGQIQAKSKVAGQMILNTASRVAAMRR